MNCDKIAKKTSFYTMSCPKEEWIEIYFYEVVIIKKCSKIISSLFSVPMLPLLVGYRLSSVVVAIGNSTRSLDRPATGQSSWVVEDISSLSWTSIETIDKSGDRG